MLILSIYVQTGARKTAYAGIHDGRPKIRLATMPIEGAANEALLRWLASVLELRRDQLRILRGASSRYKDIQVDAQPSSANDLLHKIHHAC